MTAQRGLGRGLKALIRDGAAPAADTEAPRADTAEVGVASVPVASIKAGLFQPRKGFSEEALEDLARSVKEQGIVQPLLVRKQDSGYELIAGERRLRAAARAGLAEVPVVIKEVSDQVAFEMALVENLQREDLNVLEEAEGYKALAERYSLTQEQIAARVGKARASVANTLRILELPGDVKGYLMEGKLSAGHAKALLGIDLPQEQLHLAKRVVKEGLSVRNLERIVNRMKRVPRKPRAMRDDIPSAYMRSLVDSLRIRFGTSVKVTSCRTLANGKKARGSVEIEYYSTEDLDRILEILGINVDEG